MNSTINLKNGYLDFILKSILLGLLVCSTFQSSQSHATGPCYTKSGNEIVSGAACEGDVIIDNSTTLIGPNAFMDADSITALTIPGSVQVISAQAFLDADNIQTVTLGNGIQTIGDGAFNGASGNLFTLSIPDSVHTIGAYAFNNAINLTSLTLGNSVETIGTRAFYNTPLLTSLTIPNSTISIGDDAFGLPVTLRELILGESLEIIGDSAFRNPRDLETLVIPNSVTNIGDYAFENPVNLTRLTLGNSVRRIGHNAFYTAPRLTSVTIPSSVVEIGNDAFAESPMLQEIHFRGNAPVIGSRAFEFLSSDLKIYVPYGATGFVGDDWDGFDITYGAPPVYVPPVPTYQVAYSGNSSDATSVPFDYTGYLDGQKANVSQSIPVRTGHTFIDWNTAANGSGTNYAPGSSITLGSANVSLYAQWKINSYKLSFNANGGPALVKDSLTQEYGSLTEIPMLANEQLRIGYTFLGWNTVADGSGVDYKPLSNFKFGASDMTLYAKWKINSYLVKYDGNGQEVGRVPEAKSDEFNSLITVKSPSSRFIKKGYTFHGWNTERDGSGTSFVLGDTFRLGAGDQTFFAVWKANTYQVKFLSTSKDSLPNGEFQTGGSITSAPTPAARKGYIFKGWSAKPSRTEIISFPYSPGVMRNISLYAVWAKNK